MEPHFGVVASVRADGRPHSVVTWYDLEGDEVLLSLDHSRFRLRVIRANPRVSLTVPDRSDPYRHVTVEGIAHRTYDDEGLVDIDRLALRYTGRPYETRDSPRVSAWIQIERWHGWDASQSKSTHVTWQA